MATCYYCNAYVKDGDFERHAEQSPSCARKALDFVKWMATDQIFTRSEKAAALLRCRERLSKARLSVSTLA